MRIPRLLRNPATYVTLAAAVTLWWVPSSLGSEWTPVAKGLALALTLGLGVGPFVGQAKAVWNMDPPKGAPRMDIGIAPSAPMWIGLLEVILFYAAMVAQAWSLAGGWLIFKAASKWAAWQHIIKLPDRIESLTSDASVRWMEYRHAWGSKLLTSLLLGTLANIVVALAGYAVYLSFANISLHPTAFGGGLSQPLAFFAV